MLCALRLNRLVEKRVDYFFGSIDVGHERLNRETVFLDEASWLREESADEIAAIRNVSHVCPLLSVFSPSTRVLQKLCNDVSNQIVFASVSLLIADHHDVECTSHPRVAIRVLDDQQRRVVKS